METTTREFARNFRKLRAAAARRKTVRVTTPDGVFLSLRAKSSKTCGAVLAGLATYVGRGFLTAAGAAAIEAAKRKPRPAKSPWDEAP